MVVRQNTYGSTQLDYLMISFGPLFLIIFILINCATSKKSRKLSNGTVELQKNTEVYRSREDVSDKTDDVDRSVPNRTPGTVVKREGEIVYEKTRKELVVDSTNESSGNSDGSVYAKVKAVPKKEESAYLVVNIKESSQKYDVVNGDLVRKRQQEEHTATSELYTEVETDKVDLAENSGASGYYASVDKLNDDDTIYASCENVGDSAVGDLKAADVTSFKPLKTTPDRRSKAGNGVDRKAEKKQKGSEKSPKVGRSAAEKSPKHPHRYSRFKFSLKKKETHATEVVEEQLTAVSGSSPPPLPPLDRLKHLTETRDHRIKSTATDESSSLESSPKGSPRFSTEGNFDHSVEILPSSNPQIVTNEAELDLLYAVVNKPKRSSSLKANSSTKRHYASTRSLDLTEVPRNRKTTCSLYNNQGDEVKMVLSVESSPIKIEDVYAVVNKIRQSNDSLNPDESPYECVNSTE